MDGPGAKDYERENELNRCCSGQNNNKMLSQDLAAGSNLLSHANQSLSFSSIIDGFV